MSRENRHGMHIVKDLSVEGLPITPFGKLKKLIEDGGEMSPEILENTRNAEEISTEELAELALMYARRGNLEKRVLEKKLEIDSLTGLSNSPKPHLNKLINELNFSEEKRQSVLEAVVVVFIDLNHFKQLNDEHGHANGDKALVAFSERLKTVVKGGTDLIFRPHGDEFIVVFSIKGERAISDEVIKRVFRRLQNKVNTNFFVKVENDKIDFPLSASMGYTVLKKGEFKTAEELLHEADLQMYEDKKMSR